MAIHRLLLVLVVLPLSFQAHALVKQSNSGICHDESSAYFNKTKSYTAFNTLEECLNSGGRLPKGSKAANTTSDDGYSRDKFGHGWADEDHDGQDTRQEVLISQSTGNLAYNEKGRVVKGRWISLYSGKILTNASNVDIDHIVPLSWAWKHGADKWTYEQRKDFANDPRNLVVVEASLNRQKGDKGPDEWLPPKNQEQYKLRFNRLAKIYGLK